MGKLLKNMSRSERKLHASKSTKDFSEIKHIGIVCDHGLLEAPELEFQTDMQKAHKAFHKFMDDGALLRYK